MELHVSLGQRGHWSEDVYAQLRGAILDGRLRPGDPVPATRELAARLEVSRNTVMNAYERLIAEGFLVGIHGAGTFVRDQGPPAVTRAPRSGLAPRASWRSIDLARRSATPFDFRLGAPDPALFPWDEWRRLLAKQWRGRHPPVGYGSPEGEPALREAIARHVGVSRGVRANRDAVVVTSGAQQAFDLTARVLIEPGTKVAVEEPGYPPARHAFASHGARVVPVPVDRDGLVVDALPDDARVVYVTPSHQFPLGAPMSLARRLALLAWAEDKRAAIVEDDYDSELRYDGRPLEPLQALDRNGRVIYVGTFSKVLAPSLRIGFAIAPATIASAIASARALADRHGPLEIERALAAMIDDGGLARHMRRALRVYRERRERLCDALERELGHAIEILPSAAGLHVTVLLRDRRLDADTIVARALAKGVGLASLRDYSALKPRAGLALGFGLIAAAKIDEGVARLTAAC